MTPLAYLQAHAHRFIPELQQFVCFPSISAQPDHAGCVRNCANWLARHLRSIGLENATVVKTGGHPIVFASWCRAGDAPTVLLYGHYDVQPADPVDAWTTPPFEPTVRGQHLYGRGAADDKGQLFAHVKGLECWLRSTGSLPVNVICLFEGEEEIGSASLPVFLQRHALPADVAVVSDMRILAAERPALTESLRGSLSVELRVRSARRDLHSGTFGGAVPNALQVLCEILARLHERGGRIAIPGFYDRVRDLDDAERRYMASVGPSDTEVLCDAGVRGSWGEPGYSLYERTTIRPSLAINGVAGGYQGAGAKAVIPASAAAKLNFRLVGDQQPVEINELLRHFVASIAPPSVFVDIRTAFATPAVTADRHTAFARVAAAAYRAGFGREPVYLRSGGSIPVVHLLRCLLRIPTVLMGFALPDSAMHAPDERLHLPTFYRGIHTSMHFLAGMARLRHSVAAT